MNKLKNFTRIIFFGFSILTIVLYIIITSTKTTNNYGNHYIDFTIFILGLFIVCEYIYTKKFSILPTNIFYTSALFFFCANFLGELNNFYEKFPKWDNMLHLISGILISFVVIEAIDSLICMIFIVEAEKQTSYIVFLVISAFLISVSFAVFWELYEFSADMFFGGNMQDGILVFDNTNINYLLDNGSQILDSGRYMDRALLDTINDQFLATLGAFLGTVFTFIYIKVKNQIYFPLTNNSRKL